MVNGEMPDLVRCCTRRAVAAKIIEVVSTLGFIAMVTANWSLSTELTNVTGQLEVSAEQSYDCDARRTG